MESWTSLHTCQGYAQPQPPNSSTTLPSKRSSFIFWKTPVNSSIRAVRWRGRTAPSFAKFKVSSASSNAPTKIPFMANSRVIWNDVRRVICDKVNWVYCASPSPVRTRSQSASLLRSGCPRKRACPRIGAATCHLRML